MNRSMGERVLGATLPYVDGWNAWFAWYGNSAAGLRPMLERLDAACEAAGRDPATLERTVAVHVAAPGAGGRVPGVGVPGAGGRAAGRNGLVEGETGFNRRPSVGVGQFFVFFLCISVSNVEGKAG